MYNYRLYLQSVNNFFKKVSGNGGETAKAAKNPVFSYYFWDFWVFLST